jgi:tripartite-type tricarboxylate transporter receptor subunit TctC
MAYYGIYGPKGTPQEVVDRINAAVRTTVALPDVKKRIEDTGSIVLANSPAEFAAQIRAELEVYRRVVAQQKLALD